MANSSKLTIGTYFSGGGVLEAGLRSIAIPAFAVEYDAAIAGVYQRNHGFQPIVARVQEVDFANLPHVDWFHASPECKEFSAAKTKGKEGKEQLTQTIACLRYIKSHRPQFVTFENVRGWQHSRSFLMVLTALSRYGYTYQFDVLNAADFGVPQTRERLILIASNTGRVTLPTATHHDGPTVETLWGGLVKRWVGWYAAIEDLIPTLPETQPAAWQIKRLPQDLQAATLLSSVDCTLRGGANPATTIVGIGDGHSIGPKAYLVDSRNAGQEWGKKHRVENEPSITITQTDKSSHLPKAYLVDLGVSNRDFTVRAENEPFVTILASQMRRPITSPKAFVLDGQPVPDGKGGHDALTIRFGDEPFNTVASSAARRVSRAALDGHWVRMSARCLARFQSLPDSYWLPDNNALACRVIGNGVPSLLARAVGKQIYEAKFGKQVSDESEAA